MWELEAAGRSLQDSVWKMRCGQGERVHREVTRHTEGTRTSGQDRVLKLPRQPRAYTAQLGIGARYAHFLPQPSRKAGRKIHLCTPVIQRTHSETLQSAQKHVCMQSAPILIAATPLDVSLGQQP